MGGFTNPPPPTRTATVTNSALKGKCGRCEHIFVVAHLPMELGKAASLAKRAACPKCGNAKSIYVATDEATARAEYPIEWHPEAGEQN